jgi:tetratricopeptide (TPR) repeat protein
MAKSLFRPMPSNTIEDYKQKHEFYQPLSDTHYSMTYRDGAYYQRRWQIGLNGTETNVEEMKVDYVLGSGDQARSYLHRTARGTLIELPLGWYSELGGTWGMSPGFDSRHPQTRRLVSYECSFCHTGYPKLADQPETQNAEPVFGDRLAEGIDCQRCHGPGGQHIRLAQNPNAKFADFSKTIVNPARLDSKRQMEVCMQCHLEPASGHIPSIIRKFDHDPFSYIPGQPLGEFTRYFDYPSSTGHQDRFEIVSAAYRLRKSRCFLESKDALTCLNCHNPHAPLPTGDAAIQYYATACRKCHEPALDAMVASGKHSTSPNCIACHMPKRRTEDVVHVVITDHYIQRRLPNHDLLAKLTELHVTDAEEYRGEVVPYYPAALPDTSENILYQAVAQVALQNNLQNGVAALSREMSLHPPRSIDFYTILGDAWQNTGMPKKAVTAYEEAVRLKPDSVTALQSLATALKTSGDIPRSEEMLNRALGLAPLNPNTWYQYGILEAQLGRTDSSLKKLQKALALDPDIPEGHFNLANLLVQTGQLDTAEAALRSALSIDPYDAAAYDLAGQVMARKGRSPEALYYFEKAIHLRPNYAPYLYDHALALVRTNRFDEAQEQTQAALRANPSFVEGHELLGGLFARQQKPAQAIQEFLKTVELQPDLNRAQLNLGLLMAAQGDFTNAIAHLRKAAGDKDPSIARQAATALERIGPH